MPRKTQSGKLQRFIALSEEYAECLGQGHTKTDKINEALGDLADDLLIDRKENDLRSLALAGPSLAASAWACMMLLLKTRGSASERAGLAGRLRELEGQPGLMGMVIVGFLASHKL